MSLLKDLILFNKNSKRLEIILRTKKAKSTMTLKLKISSKKLKKYNFNKLLIFIVISQLATKLLKKFNNCREQKLILNTKKILNKTS